MKENGVVPYSYQTMQCATQAKQHNVSKGEKNKNYIAETALQKQR